MTEFKLCFPFARWRTQNIHYLPWFKPSGRQIFILANIVALAAVLPNSGMGRGGEGRGREGRAGGGAKRGEERRGERREGRAGERARRGEGKGRGGRGG